MKRLASHLLVVTGAVLVLGSALAPQGCAGKAGEVCDAFCECVLCNDREEDECRIDANQNLDRAAAHECDVEAEALADCVVADGECDDGSFSAPDCGDEFEELNDCIADSSDLDSGSVQGPGPSPSSPASTGSGDVCPTECIGNEALCCESGITACC
jgi:hypothetical protein